MRATPTVQSASSANDELTALPITKPVFGPEELRAIEEVLRSGWVVQGPRVAAFERLFADFVGAKHAIATTSCTSALHLALLAAGIGPGDEVLVPAFTFVASANAVEYVGARPVFVDVRLDTFTIDLSQAERILRSKQQLGTPIKAIMPVSLFGLPAPMGEINKLAGQYHAVVIEDAACGLGGYRDGHHTGTEALAGCFSLHPRKAITTGEGGMIVTGDDQIAGTVRQLRDHGASKTDLERHLTEGGSLLPNYDRLGYNHRMTDLQGAMGVAQMGKLRSILDGRRLAAEGYLKTAPSLSQLTIPHIPQGMQHGWQSFVCMVSPEGPWTIPTSAVDWSRVTEANKVRNRLMAFLEKHKISVRQGTHAVHTLGYYRNKYRLGERDFPGAYLADRLSMTLPLYAGMTPLEQIRVVDTISDFFAQ